MRASGGDDEYDASLKQHPTHDVTQITGAMTSLNLRSQTIPDVTEENV